MRHHFIIIKRRRNGDTKDKKKRDRFSKRATKSDEDRARHGNGEKERIQKRSKKREGEKSRIGRGFSHVTTPHVRRQIFTRGRREGEGREGKRRGDPWDARVRSPVTAWNVFSLSLSLFSPFLSLLLSREKILRDTVSRISSSRKPTAILRTR